MILIGTVLLSVALLGLGGLVGHWLTRRRQSRRIESTSASAPAPLRRTHRTPLVVLVSIGTIAVTLLGVALFAWLAWLLSHQPAPWNDPNGWRAFVSQVDGTRIFDAARITVTLLAIIGIGGAALVAYRRQDTTERSHQVAIEAQETAANQYKLDSDKYELDRKRHELETHRRADDRERELRARFTTIAEQLGSKSFAVRHAGAYALASLADDWHEIGKDVERQICVDLLCAQLRSPRDQEPLYPDDGRVYYSASDTEVRKTIIRLLRSHRPLDPDISVGWKACAIDLSAADLTGFDLTEIDLRSANLDDADLSHAQLVRADLSEAMMARTTLSGTKFIDANLAKAKLFSSRVEVKSESEVWPNMASFERANLAGALLTSANLPHAEFEGADLTGAYLNSARLQEASFLQAVLSDTHCYDTKFNQADFRNADLRRANFVRADTTEANFTDAIYDGATKWRHNQVPEGVRRLREDEDETRST